jgi:signal transduction histidine kinase
MQTISRRLSLLFVSCSIATILLVILFVNITVTSKFNHYMADIQNKRYERIVTHFEEIYKREGKWTETSGVELMHEAYMGNYCLTLMDSNKVPVWGMDPTDLENQMHVGEMSAKENGVYTSKTYEIEIDNRVVGYVDIGQYSSVLMSEEDINFKGSIIKSIVASGILTLIIITFLSLYFSKQFSNPIRDAAKMSVRLSKGDFEAKSNIITNIKELEDLRNSVNILAGKLKYQDTLRKRLVSDISHEIRTPLNILQNNLEAMVDGVLPVTQETLVYLNQEVIRFGKLINNLNVLKEFEDESITLNYEALSLDEIITDICRDFFRIAENKQIKIDYYIQPNVEDYLITGDKDKLKQVFINVISNALKFTETNGKVLIKLYETSNNLVVEISDNGMGIRKEDLPYIFERLYRGDKSRQQIEGNGIGLTIVKNILQLHNASVDVVSEEGERTTIKIYFTR